MQHQRINYMLQNLAPYVPTSDTENNTLNHSIHNVMWQIPKRVLYAELQEFVLVKAKRRILTVN